MSNREPATASPEPTLRPWIAPVAIGLAAFLAAVAAASYRQRPQQAPCQARDNDLPLQHPQGNVNAPTGFAPDEPRPTVEPTSSRRSASATVKQVVGQRPAVSVTVIAVVIAIITTALVTAPRFGDATPAQPSWNVPPFDAPDPPRQDSQTIPISDVGKSSGHCTSDGICSGRSFTMYFAGDRPWLVTQVGFRPLEILPGRRVTRVRWEISDISHLEERGMQFFQTEDTLDAFYTSNFSTAHLRGGGYRTTQVTAVVEESTPAPGAVGTHLPPFGAFGYPAPDSGDAEFPTRRIIPDPGAGASDPDMQHDTTTAGPPR